MNEQKFLEEWLEEANKKTKGRVTLVSSEVLDTDHKPPTKFYIVDWFGNGVFFKTRSRVEAQKLCDLLYGKNFFVVREVIKIGNRV